MKKLIFVGGPAGSGKTRFSEDLAERLKAVIIDKDTVSQIFSSKILEVLGQSPHDRESDVYKEHVFPAEYDTLQLLAVDNITLNTTDVVCSAPFMSHFLDEVWLGQIEDIIEQFGAKLMLVWMHSDAETAKPRLISRNEPRDHWKLNNWDAYNQVTGYNPPSTKRLIHVIENKSDSEESLEVQLDSFINELARLDQAYELIEKYKSA